MRSTSAPFPPTRAGWSRIPGACLLPLTAALALAGCGDGATEPVAQSSLKVELTVGGEDWPTDLLTVTLHGEATERTSEIGSAPITFPGLVAGTYQLSLTGIPDNCSATSGDTITLEIRESAIESAAFQLTCFATGLEVRMAVEGIDQDRSFELVLDGQPYPIGPGQATRVTRLLPGTHTVAFDDVAPNCSLESPAGVTQSVVITSREVLLLDVTARCVASTGVILVTATTEGDDLDVDGYVVTVGGASLNTVPTNGSVPIPSDAGDWQVTIGGMAPNCQVEGEGTRTVSVQVGGAVRDTALVDFRISCDRFWTIAFSRSGTRWVTTEDGSVTALLGPGDEPTWSPDGRRLAWRCGGTLCVSDYGNVPRTQFVLPWSLIQGPSWRPDGEAVAVLAYDSYWYYYTLRFIGLYVVPVDGGAPVRVPLPGSVTQAHSASWSPDGSAIAFDCQVGNGPNAICRVGPDGSSFARLTPGTLWAYGPAWRSDGTRIAFGYGGSPATSLLATMNPDGSDIRPVGSGIIGSDPTWSPDGEWILFSRSDAPETFGLYRVREDGTELTRITGRLDLRPRWRP